MIKRKMAESEVDCYLCDSCHVIVVEPYIRCAACGPSFVNLCTICFSHGREFDEHENNHPYFIIRSDFSLFDEDWTANEELVFLDLITDRGFGNWVDISTQLSTRTVAECEQHYLRHYINHSNAHLPKFPDVRIPSTSPILFKLSDDPPRPKDSSLMCAEMAGYSAARGDMTVEADNFMELDLNSLEMDEQNDSELDTELKTCILFIYWNCLRERRRRKRIVRDYGLINLRKSHVSSLRYLKALGPWVDKLRVFMHLLTPDEFIKYLELLKYEREIKQSILTLMELRTNGVTRLRNVVMYESLKSRRGTNSQRPHLLTDILDHIQDESACRAWLQNHQVLESISKGDTIPLPSVPRRSAPPLEISGFPGYEKLDDSEKQLCRTVRLVPNAYTEFREILEAEYHTRGSLRLAQARVLLKIDVNKTRKLYDFLVTRGSIKKDTHAA